MSELPISGLQMVEEDAASGQVSEIFGNIQRVMEIPFVPNIDKAAAGAANVLQATWDVFRNIFLSTSLPMSLASMIMYSIAVARKCRYCSAVHQVTCKTLGVEEETLAALQADLGALTPQRVSVIVAFAQKCALDPQGLVEADYEAVRDQGVSEQELVEIIGLAALGNYLDTLTDAMKVEIDQVFTEALRG